MGDLCGMAHVSLAHHHAAVQDQKRNIGETCALSHVADHMSSLLPLEHYGALAPHPHTCPESIPLCHSIRTCPLRLAGATRELRYWPS